jgi:AbrB family looped-hinge helix DNA binding protein
MLLRIRRNAQITLPARLRKAAQIEDGDLLDCEVEDGRIVLTPKKLIDKRDAWFWSPGWRHAEAEAQQDIENGDIGEFASADELIDHLKKD